jgi:hypothetical protein
MSSLDNVIIKASQNQLIEELVGVDDVMEEPEIEVREQVAEQVAQEVITTLQVPEEPEPMDDVMVAYPKNRHRSAEAEMQDRLLTIPRRPSLKEAPWGSLWVTHTGFLEQVALLNITKSEQRSLLRQWADIQVLSEGDGNADIVEHEQDIFALKIVSYKSRSDNPEKGIRERTAHITNKTISDQNIQIPKNEVQKSGFLNTILGRNKQPVQNQ